MLLNKGTLSIFTLFVQIKHIPGNLKSSSTLYSMWHNSWFPCGKSHKDLCLTFSSMTKILIWKCCSKSSDWTEDDMKLGQCFHTELNEYSLSQLFSCSAQLKLHSNTLLPHHQWQTLLEIICTSYIPKINCFLAYRIKYYSDYWSITGSKSPEGHLTAKTDTLQPRRPSPNTTRHGKGAAAQHRAA